MAKQEVVKTVPWARFEIDEAVHWVKCKKLSIFDSATYVRCTPEALEAAIRREILGNDGDSEPFDEDQLMHFWGLIESLYH